MTTPVSHSFPQEWKGLLLEAIQQRNAPQAVSLAQRYVHRYGMHALDQLLESVNGALGQNGEARAWLLPLLTQPSAQQDPSPARTAAAPEPQPHRRQPPTLDEAFAPLEIAFPPMPAAGYGAAEVLDSRGALDSASSPVGVDSSCANLVSTDRLDAENLEPENPEAEYVDEELINEKLINEKLIDEERVGERLIDEVSLAQEPVDAESTDAGHVGQIWLVEELEGVEDAGQAEQNGSGQNPQQERLLPARGTGQDLFNGETMALPQPTSLNSWEEGVAAPVPTFQLEGEPERQPVVPRVRYSQKSERRYTNRPAPISPALQPWIAWLNGAGPSRPRS